MMRRQRFHRETLELAPFARRREALFVAERELDKAWVAQSSIDLGVGRVEQLRDPSGRDGEDVLQVQQRLDSAGSKRTAERTQVLEINLEGLARPPSERVQHDAAAERAQIGLVAHDEAVAGKRDHRVSEHDLDECAPFGRDLAGLFEHDHAADRLGSADKETDALVALQCALCGGANLESRVEPHRRDLEPFVGEHIAAFELEPFAAGQVERDALAEACALDRLAMHLYRTNAHLLAGRQHAQLLSGPDDCAHGSAGHDRAMALDYERAIDRQPKEAGGTARLEAIELARNLRAQLIEAYPAYRRDRDYRRALEPGGVGEQLDFFAHFREAFIIRQVRLRDQEDAALDAKQMKDVEMLLALRHHAVVGCDREQHEVHPMRTGKHVADEPLMARDVDHARARPVPEREIREPEVDRNAALLLFLETVGILISERLDQRGLAMVDMTGGADNRMGDLRSHRYSCEESKVSIYGWTRGAVSRRPRLPNLLHEHFEVEVVAPRRDFAGGGDLEYAHHRQRRALAIGIGCIDTLVEDNVAVGGGVQNFELEQSCSLEQTVDDLEDRLLAVGRLHWNVVIKGVVGEEAHHLVRVESRPCLAKIRYDSFGFR